MRRVIEFFKFGTKSKLFWVFIFTLLFSFFLNFLSVFFALPYAQKFIGQILGLFGLSISASSIATVALVSFIFFEIFRRVGGGFTIKAMFRKDYRKRALFLVVPIVFFLAALSVVSSFLGSQHQVKSKNDNTRQITQDSTNRAKEIKAEYMPQIKSYQDLITSITRTRNSRKPEIVGIKLSGFTDQEKVDKQRYQSKVDSLTHLMSSDLVKSANLFTSKKTFNTKDVAQKSSIMGYVSIIAEVLIYFCIIIIQFFWADFRRIKSDFEKGKNKAEAEGQSKQSDALIASKVEQSNVKSILEHTFHDGGGLTENKEQSEQSNDKGDKVDALSDFLRGNNQENVQVILANVDEVMVVLDALEKCNNKTTDAQVYVKTQNSMTYNRFYFLKRCIDKKDHIKNKVAA